MYRQKMLDSIRAVYTAAVSAVSGQSLIQANIRLESNNLVLRNHAIPLGSHIYVVGFGKAVLGMAEELVRLVPTRLHGILSVPWGSVDARTIPGSDIEIRQCARNNLPDEASVENAREIRNLVEKCGEDDVVLVLISGGGSACLSLPEPGLSLGDKLHVIKLLVQAGADIKELNAVRKKLSAVKGGKLAVSAYPAKVIGLIISDIVGDPLQDIASGPTASDTFGASAMDCLVKYKLDAKIPSSVLDIIKEQAPAQDEVFFKNVHNFILGNNSYALHSAQQKAESLGYRSFVLSCGVEGFGGDVCGKYMELVKHIAQVRRNRRDNPTPNDTTKKDEMNLKTSLSNWNSSAEILEYVQSVDKLKLCLVSGGEVTWDMSGVAKVGIGGRNLHLTLLAQRELQELVAPALHVWFSSAGTDGIDGMTDVAGSIAYNHEQVGDLQRALDGFDSFNYYKGGDLVIQPGHTGTNVMDVHILVLEEE